MKYDHRFILKENNGSSFRFVSEEGEGKSITAGLDFFENAVRVSFVKSDVPLFPTYTVCPDGKCPREGRDKLSFDGLRSAVPNVQDLKNDPVTTSFRFTLPYATVTLDPLNFRLSFENEKGLLFRDRDYISLNLGHELGRGSTHYITREPSEKIFGLGDKTGNVNKNGMYFKLGTSDAMGFDASSSDPLYKHLPFYICENSKGAYGIYYDTYSNGEFTFGKELNNYYDIFKGFRCNEENLVFYVLFGTVPEIVRHFSTLCGPIFFPPKWTLKYCGSTMSYTDADNADEQLRGFLDSCEKNGITPGGFYLSSGYTQIGEKRCVFHWNTDKIPDPEGLAAFFKDHGTEFLPNVKPAFLTDHPMYDMIAENGWFLHYKDGSPAVFPFWSGFGSYLDFTDPGAYDFWRECVKKDLVARGYKNIWNDNNEYDVCDEDVYADGFGTPVKAADIRPLFSFLMTMASLEAQDKSVRHYSVSRCGIGGLQRIAATWTGDNRTYFPDLRYNHKMAMTMSLSGFYNFGQDIGGFSGPKPGKELFIRWIQYGLFTPRFTLHSWKPGSEPTMPWLYPDLMPEVKALFDLRESLVPYLSNEMYESTLSHDPVISPVFLKYPGFDEESDMFFFGRDILSCPVFDEGETSVNTVLPESAHGRYLGCYSPDAESHTIKTLYNGTVSLPASIHDMPVWFVQAGSVIPREYNNKTVFEIYALNKGSFSYRYLNDDGISNLTGNETFTVIDVSCDGSKVTVKITGAPEGTPVRVIDCKDRDVNVTFSK